MHKVINLPLTYRVNRRSDKWVLKQIASRYLPGDIVNRKKTGFPLPLEDYLAPLARNEIFNNGFCHQVLGLSSGAVQKVVASWKENIQAFFNLLSLEIWGRLFILQEPLAQVSDLLSHIENPYQENRLS